MKITEVQIKNYRNLDGVLIKPHEEICYILGENNLGKSNFLALLYKLGTRGGFDEEDFFDKEKDISVDLTMKLNVEERGLFEDNFSPDDPDLVKLRITQSIKDRYPQVFKAETMEKLSSGLLRKIHFLEYNSAMNPQKELKFDGSGGGGLVFQTLLERFFETNPNPEFLDHNFMEDLELYIGNNLSKIRGFQRNSIGIESTDAPKEILAKLVHLTSSGRNIENAGSGIQYLAMAAFSVLSQIAKLKKNKAIPFEERLYTKTLTNEKILPVILAIDEPEVHLHPYMQRSLIRFYKRILDNEDKEFKELLNLCFGIDGLDGQLLVVTHSTDSLVDSFRNIVRFYLDNQQTRVISGTEIKMESKLEKTLRTRFPEFKEAFFARCAHIAEGATEHGCMAQFADKLDMSFDDYGICVINADGERSIESIRMLLSTFKIPSVAMYDLDAKKDSDPKNTFYTDKPCFEAEIIWSLIDNHKLDLMKEIILELESQGCSLKLDNGQLNKWKNYLKAHHFDNSFDIDCINGMSLQEILENTDEKLQYHGFSAWLISKKSIFQGRAIGEILPAEVIPSSFKRAILGAVEVSKNEERN